MTKEVYRIDGEKFSSLEEFAEHFSDVVLKIHRWNGGLDAFNDVLSGGFGTPEEGFKLVWVNSERSRSALGHAATVKFLQAAGGLTYAELEQCERERLQYTYAHPRFKARIEELIQQNTELEGWRCHARRLELAKQGQGDTVFDWIVEIIRDHGPGGEYEEDGIELLLL